MLKKILCVLLALAVVFSIAGCGSNKNDSNELISITPYEELPAFTGNFKLVFDNISEEKLSKSELEEIIGYMISAYYAYSAEDFCEYMSEQDFTTTLTAAQDAITARGTELILSSNVGERDMAVILTTVAADFSDANVSYAQWRVKNSAYKINDKYTAEELKDEMKYIINEYTVMFFGQAVVS